MMRKELLNLNIGSTVRVWYPDLTIKDKKYHILKKHAVSAYNGKKDFTIEPDGLFLFHFCIYSN
ncbi:hypothetical protein CON22_24935 [Bacillus cereus]|nr:hypothetical protein CON22_24935 [Bacillus cereus]